jgi:hypothetical protein
VITVIVIVAVVYIAFHLGAGTRTTGTARPTASRRTSTGRRSSEGSASAHIVAMTGTVEQALFPARCLGVAGRVDSVGLKRSDRA